LPAYSKAQTVDCVNSVLPKKVSNLKTHIETRAFSAVSAESFNNVFSADYDDYFFKLNYIGSAIQVLRMRLRVSGTDNSSSNNYLFGRFSARESTTSAGGSVGDTGFTIAGGTNARKSNIGVNINRPFATDNTSFSTLGNSGTTDPVEFVQIHGGSMTVTTSYDGFTLFPASGTITGTISIYGYAKV
jgi:hypothetical protein